MSYLDNFVSSAKDFSASLNNKAQEFFKPIADAYVKNSWMLDNYNKVYGHGSNSVDHLSDKLMADMITGERAPSDVVDIIKTGFNNAATESGVEPPFKDTNDDSSNGPSLKPTSSNPTYSRVQGSVNSGSTVDYLNADLARHYGMDAKSAYAEALQNTAYQRAVADLKAAGLNPVLAVNGFSPAGSFVAGDTFVPSNTFKGGSGAGSSGAASSNSGKYAMSSNLYNALGAAASIVGAVVGFKHGTGPFKFMNAATVSVLAKDLTQAAIQGYGSLFGNK